MFDSDRIKKLEAELAETRAALFRLCRILDAYPGMYDLNATETCGWKRLDRVEEGEAADTQDLRDKMRRFVELAETACNCGGESKRGHYSFCTAVLLSDAAADIREAYRAASEASNELATKYCCESCEAYRAASEASNELATKYCCESCHHPGLGVCTSCYSTVGACLKKAGDA